MDKRATILTISGVTIAGLLAYAVYFDYKRRNDVEFRKQLRKDKKRVHKAAARTKDTEASQYEISQDDLRAALEKVKKEELPRSQEQSEAYFMGQVNLGEQLSSQGPNSALQAALCFYRALRVYPSPVELIVIYQKTVPEPIFKLVMALTNLDVVAKVEGYYNHFPPKSMNVSVKTDAGLGKANARKILTVTKDIGAGEVIYREKPVVTALDFDLEGKGTHCSHCLRVITKGLAIAPPSDCLASVYCSRECLGNSKIHYQNLLFTTDPLPSVEPSDGSPKLKADRLNAQTAFVSHMKRHKKASPLLAAKFIARQVSIELAKMFQNIPMPTTDLPGSDPDGEEYGLNDHVERLRYLELEVIPEESELLRNVLRYALPGLEGAVTDERYAILLGKMAYNLFGVSFATDDKAPPMERPEDVGITRTAFGPSGQVGSAFYLVSSYIGHSCNPSARSSFSNGTAELHLIATRALKAGDEVTIAYVNVTQHAGETPTAARRRRRMELVRGWRFACTCERCVAEGAVGPGGSDRDLSAEQKGDQSRVEDVVGRVERSAGVSEADA